MADEFDHIFFAEELTQLYNEYEEKTGNTSRYYHCIIKSQFFYDWLLALSYYSHKLLPYICECETTNSENHHHCIVWTEKDIRTAVRKRLKRIIDKEDSKEYYGKMVEIKYAGHLINCITYIQCTFGSSNNFYHRHYNHEETDVLFHSKKKMKKWKDKYLNELLFVHLYFNNMKDDSANRYLDCCVDDHNKD